MANRRMFSMDIIDSDAFLDMPQSSQLLYYHLGMRADDDGFVSPKKIMRLIGAADDDLKVLLTKRFLLPFENGVVVIKHWLIHNLIRKDRYHETRYIEQKKTLNIKENGAYTEMTTNGLPNGNQMATEVRLGKVRLGKNNTDSVAFSEDFLLYWKEYPNKTGKLVAYKSWKKINPSITLQKKMMNTLTKQKNSEQWQKEKGRFIPNPATWLNQGRWDDEIKENKTKIQYY